MKTIETQTENTEVRHHWKPMEEYKIDYRDVPNLRGDGEGSRIDAIKKIPPNKYIVLHSSGRVENYLEEIENLRKEGLDIGKGDCQYGWKMPTKKRKRELRIFRRS
ncbi:MAG: hypothetical protein WD876_02680 [Candidatus Pacearchaeota archaeon]